jgi:DNA-directed RNA polymerase specialized sigma24 family protein
MSQASILPLAGAALAECAEPRLERMFRTHRELIWRPLRRLGMSPDAAAGTQQAFLVAMERLDHIRPGAERAFLSATRGLVWMS